MVHGCLLEFMWLVKPAEEDLVDIPKKQQVTESWRIRVLTEKYERSG